MPLIGAHVSTSGGSYHAFANAQKIGANAIQIFGASPRQWNATLPTQESLEKFHAVRKNSPVEKIFLHASYLVNLGTPDEELYQKSLKNLTTHLKIAELLGAEGLVYHIGSYKNSTLEESNKRVAQGMLKVLEDAPGKAHLIMENSAGGGNKIGLTAKEIGDIFKLANHPRIKVCIDTAHALGAGLLENFSPQEIDSLAQDCDKAFGLENLTVLHVNDSKVPFNSKKDRHENIGDGHIGKQAFANLAQHPHFQEIPWILEVPGYEGKGPDKQNIDILTSLI